MEAEAIQYVPTPLSPTKRKRLAAMGSAIARESKAAPAKSTTDYETPRLSEGLLNASVGDDGHEEFNRILLMRRSKVDGEGTTWESPVERPPAFDHDDAYLRSRLAHCGSTPVPSTPDHGPAPWPSSGRPRDEERNIDDDPLRSTRSSIEGGLPATPPRKKTAPSSKLTAEQKASIAPHLSPEQLDLISGAFSSSQSGPSEEDETKSQGSSGNASGSSPSPKGGPKGGGSRRRRGSVSCPPPPPGSLYDEVPKYPDLRKRRSLGGGSNTSALKVRFQDENGVQLDSDDDKTSTPSSKVRGRRVSRGPDGAPYKVEPDSDDADSEDAEARAPSANGISVGTYATAVAKGATGAFCGGATGAAVGLGGALFTFGLSVPICALVGSTYGGFYGVSSALPPEENQPGTSRQRRGRGSAPPGQEESRSEEGRRRRHSRE